MKFNKDIKSNLWFILERYDNHPDYNKLCNSLSNLIQDKGNIDDILVIFQSMSIIDLEDKKIIDKSIGADIDACLFSI